MLKREFSISNKSLVMIKASLLAAVLIGLVVFFVNVVPVFAQHEAIVTITPDIANCDQLGRTFTVNVKNDGSSQDEILQVEIYKALAGISDFACGPAPAGWSYLPWPGEDRCIYVTGLESPDKIAPGEDLDFTFNAKMSSDSCNSTFIVATTDDYVSPGQRNTYQVQVKIDCTPPVIDKAVGDPKIPGDVFDWWVTSNTDIEITVTDSTEDDECNLGLDNCSWRVTVDGVVGGWNYEEDGEEIYWVINLDGDSNHYIEIECYDEAGNKATLTETDKVDDTPPITTKDVSEPKKEVGSVEWVDTTTEITLNAIDPDPTGHGCNIGVDKTWYRNDLVEDLNHTTDVCWDPGLNCHYLNLYEPTPYGEEEYEGCIEDGQSQCGMLPRDTDPWYDCVEGWAYSTCGIDPAWKLYRGVPIQKDEESCHVLQYFSIDHLGNIEDTNFNCFFVDKTPPIPSKVIGDPKYGDCHREPEPCEGWDCVEAEGLSKDFFTTGRHGGTGWKNGIIDVSIDPFAAQVSNNVVWPDGVAKDFSVNYDPSTGDVTYTQGTGGGQTVLTYNYGTNKAFEYVIPVAKGNNKGASTELTELVINGKPLPVINSGSGIKGIWVPLTDAEQVNGFTITGKAKLIRGPSPNDERPAFHIFAMNTHGLEPEDCWLRDEHLDKFGYLVEGTPITLDCTDPEPHPSDDEEVCYKVSLDGGDVTCDYCPEDLEYIEQPEHVGWWCCVPAPKEIVFKEDSLHDLEWFCRDAVDKKSEIDLEWFRVDSLPPIINKTMIGDDHLGDCPPRNLIDDLECFPDGDICYVKDDGQNGVNITVWDNETYGCAVDNVTCIKLLLWITTEEECGGAGGDWLGTLSNEQALQTLSNEQVIQSIETLINNDDGICLLLADEFNESQEVIFTQDSIHILVIGCEDALGNVNLDVEIYFVDSIPPETEKIYGWPHKVDPVCYDLCLDMCGYGIDPLDGPECLENCLHHTCTWWVNSSTQINLTAYDEKVGVDGTFYNNTLVPDDFCWNPNINCYPEGIIPAEMSAGSMPIPIGYKWKEYIGPIYKEEESCHMLIYWSNDSLGNKEFPKWQCFFVDNTPPTAYKEHGEPIVHDDGFDWVTQDTPIWLNCTDQGDHPVNQETLWWRFSNYTEPWDGCPTYSEWYSAPYTEFDVEIHFEEDCWHDLEYYCVDHLGNVGNKHTQYYIVDTEPPVINKSIVGPQYGDCPPEENGGDCYIDTATEIHVNPYDPEPHPVNDVTCYWWYYVNGDRYPESGVYSTFPITFPQESEHELHIKCKDALDNEVEDVEIFIVDKTPPETTKHYGEPYFENAAEWINQYTDIWFTAHDETGDHVSGVNETKYRITGPIDDKYCEDELECEVNATGSGNWQTYTDGYIQITDESCHLIEYYSIDNVDKEETIKKQCVFVDNTPPYPNKTVGEPKSKWDGKDSIFYKDETAHCWDGTEDEIECWDVTMQTPISLECIDPQPHPVDHEIVCFKIEVDGKDETERYCSFVGDYNETGDGYCCLESEIEDFLFWEETEHNLKYYCIDALGNSNKGDVDEEKFKVHRATFKIPLYKKWNLISVPFMLLNDTPEEVFKNTEGVESVWALDGNEWLVWTPGPAPDTLEFIEPGWGYWVLENKDEPDDNNCDIERVGCEPAEWLIIGGELFEEGPVLPPGRDLVKGWNLIGYYGTSWELYPLGDANFMCGDAFECFDRFVYGDKAYCALNSLINTNSGYPKWSSLWSYLNCGCYNTYWLGLNACADKSLQQLIDRMYAGRGYWLELDEEDFYSPATVCIWNSNFECVWTGGGYIP